MGDEVLDELLSEYDTPSKKKQVSEYLINLVGSEGWKVLLKILNQNIKDLTDVVVDPGDMEAVEVDRLRDKIKLQKGLCKLPVTLIEALGAVPTTNNVDLDPYYK